MAIKLTPEEEAEEKILSTAIEALLAAIDSIPAKMKRRARETFKAYQATGGEFEDYRNEAIEGIALMVDWPTYGDD